MFLDCLRVRNFGPFSELNVHFSPIGINLIAGHNGCGRTQLVGAIAFALLGTDVIEVLPDGRFPCEVDLTIREPEIAEVISCRASGIHPSSGELLLDRAVDSRPPGPEQCGPLPGTVTTSLDTPRHMAEAGGFPVFAPSTLPSGHRPGAISLIQYKTGKAFGGSISYESYNSAVSTWENTLSITADLHYPRPCPLWPGTPAGPDDIAAALEKVSSLPSPGVVMRSAAGYVFYWVWKDVLYTLRAEFGPTYEEALDVVSSLVLVNG